MVKYRKLTKEELLQLEQTFIEFLVLNGITADDWEKIKEKEKEKSHQLLDAFSNTIIEGALQKTEYLEKHNPKKISCIHFQEKQMVMVTMEAPDDSDADFTDPKFIQKATTSPPSYLKVYTASSAYQDTREMVLFKYTENGWLVSDGKLYKALALSLG